MKYNLNCHCGAVQLEVLTDLEIIKQCNCSICIRKNAKMCMVPKEAINILKGKENLIYMLSLTNNQHFQKTLAFLLYFLWQKV